MKAKITILICAVFVPGMAGSTGAIGILSAECDCVGDMNNDGWLSSTDVSALTSQLLWHGDNSYWVEVGEGHCGDINGDGWLSSTDVSALVSLLLPYADDFYWVECINGVELPVYEKIEIINDTSINGAFDLALEYKNADEGYMVYTSVNYPALLHTHLAKTPDNGKTWTFVKRLTSAYEDVIVHNEEEKEGIFVNEVPTLVYVPDDAGKRWKLYWHRCFSVATPTDENPNKRQRILDHGWIMMKEANRPENLDDAEEIKLFATSYAVEPALVSFEDYVGEKVPIHSYSEPASLYLDGVMYIALSWFGASKDDTFTTLFLVASDDYGKTWRYIGESLTRQDGADFGYDYFTSASLADEGGRVFLLASPIDKGKHVGTYVFEYEDISTGELVRDGKGKPVVSKVLKPSVPEEIGGNSGESDYDKYNAYGGIIMSELNAKELPKAAALYNTKEGLI